ncbi:antitoxin VbhA family protein [Ensifer sp. SL37]|uniref:antitoxin VbhA family protein n=1 Tax=Ensifer sp. SL37 TaxID=2995137 RepID=UPI002273F439|nr:antitoxin VbhA family protein [Ensifer sp. SL37]MCY1740850.1 antitoxin VbhA family protein [Ensifer sp. SL37]
MAGPEKPAQTSEEIAQNRAALDAAIGSLRLEGIEPDAESLAEMHRIVRGEITPDEAIANIKARFKSAL